MEEELYYIQNGYVGNAVSWWAVDANGYTTDFKQAGKFTKKFALTTREIDRAFPVSYIDSNEKAQKLIIDGQYLDRRHELKK